MEKSARKILVVGGAGYLGCMVCRHLLDAGYAVKSVDAEWFGNFGSRSLQQNKRYRSIRLDTRQIDRLTDVACGVDAVIHLSGIVGDPACALDEDFTYSCNYLSTISLSKLCKRAGIKRFIFASSCSVYGDGASEEVHENSPTKPLSVYARDKLMCEDELLQMTDHQFWPTIFRLSTLFGWSPRMRFDLVVNLLTVQAASGAKMEIFGGEQWRPFLHISDAANAFRIAIESSVELIKGKVFNVGASENNYRIIDVGHQVCEMVPSASLTVHSKVTDKRNYMVSFEKIERELGYKAGVSVLQGIKEILRQVSADGPIDFQRSGYQNYLQTRELVRLREQSRKVEEVF